MRTLLTALLLAALAGPARALDAREEFARALDAGEYPAVSFLLEKLGGSRGAPAAAYAETAPAGPEERAAEWRDLDRLLRGGRLDRGGMHIRRELAKLPAGQWGFVVKLDRERRRIYDKLGWGPGGNIMQNACAAFGKETEPKLCYQRTEQLTASVGGLLRAYSGWQAKEVIANEITDKEGMSDFAAMLHGMTHHAPCFVYEVPGGRVELVADAWANALAPAYTWWYAFDKDTHNYLYRAGGRDWCGEKTISDALRAQQQARRAGEARRGQLYESIKEQEPF